MRYFSVFFTRVIAEVGKIWMVRMMTMMEILNAN